MSAGASCAGPATAIASKSTEGSGTRCGQTGISGSNRTHVKAGYRRPAQTMWRAGIDPSSPETRQVRMTPQALQLTGEFCNCRVNLTQGVAELGAVAPQVAATASMTNSDSDLEPVFSMMAARWTSTVRWLMPRSAAMILLG